MSTLLEARQLGKEFHGFRAVWNVNLTVRRGSIHALIGPNGAGKSTCFGLLSGFLRPTRGEILFDGKSILGTPPEVLAGKGLVRSFQISAVFESLTVLENVLVPLQRENGLSLSAWRTRSALHRFEERAHALLQKLGLSEYANEKAADLSYGRKRALEIATTLALDPQLMLLDEPTAGMTEEDVDRIMVLIKEIAKDRTILMVEHNMKIIRTLADSVTVLARGEILAEGSYSEVSAHPEVKRAYLGEEDDE